MNVRKKTTFSITVLCVFMLILVACPSAFVYIPNKDDRIPPNALDNNVERAQRPYWLVRPFGSNKWVSPGTESKVGFHHGVELIARSDTPGAVIHYASGDSFAEIPAFSGITSATKNESDPFKLEGSFNTRSYKAAAEAPLFFPSNSNTLIVTIYPEQPETPSFPDDKKPGNYDTESLNIEFKEQGFNIYYNIVIYPEDTNKNGKLDPEEFITPSGNDDNVTINVSDPDPENFPKIDDDPLSGVIGSSFEPDGGYKQYADNFISPLIRGQTACVKAYAAHEKYRPSYRPPLEEDGSPTGILQGCFSVVATVPAAPAVPTLTAVNTELEVAWSAPNNNGGSKITGYKLQYKVSTATSWTLITSGITGTSHTITGLTNGTAYQVRVSAVNKQGSGTWSTFATATPATVPAAPTAPTLEAGDGSLTVTWTAPDNGGSKITGYHLRYSSDSGSTWTEITEGITGTSTSGITDISHTITGLTNGTEYQVQVRAVNAQGNGTWSPSAAATPATVPAAPAAPTLAVGNGRLVVKWTAPDNNGGSEITGYHVQHRIRATGDWSPTDTDNIATITDGTISHTITDLTNGTAYQVQVRAVNAQGNGTWSTSATETPATRPDAPAAPTLAVGNGRLVVEWTAPDDGGSAITGYHLRYSSDSGSTWTEITEGLTATSYTIQNLTNGTAYQVQVRAKNSVREDAGNGAGVGPWSTIATATLLVPVFATQVPSGTAASVVLSTAIDTQIFTENLTVSLASVTTPTTTVTPPTVTASTGLITVTADTTAGTYLVSGVDGGNTVRFSEHFYVTVSPADNAALDTQVTAGISTWGNTADLNYILTTGVTNMSNMFEGANAFTGDISGWDVSSVTNMYYMFFNAHAFTGDISGWDVRAVENMGYMFSNANKFNGNISGWNTNSVTTMSGMFYNADAFNRDISNWDVGKVTNMSGMFSEADKFNGDLSNWDVSSVTYMTGMFFFDRDRLNSASAFNGDISGWNTRSVTDMRSMFDGASVFNRNISDWNVSSVTDMRSMFDGASVFNGDISDWNVSSVTKMDRMFDEASAFNQDLEEWKDHWTLVDGKYTGSTTSMFNGSGVNTTNGNVPSWY